MINNKLKLNINEKINMIFKGEITMKLYNMKYVIMANVIKFILGFVCIGLDLRCFSTCLNSNNLMEIMFSSVLVLSGIWVSCYLLLVELYKDRYQFDIMKQELLPVMKNKIIDIICLVILGVIILIINHNSISAVYYAILTAISIAQVFRIAYDTSNSLMVNTYVDKFIKDIEKEIEKKDSIEDTVVLKKIKNILDESILKGEYFVTQNICEKTSGIFRCFLKNSIGKENVEENFNTIADLNIYELQLCEKIDSDSLRLKIAKQQYKNLMFCVKNHQTEWYKKYLEKYNYYIFQLQKNTENDLKEYLEELYYVYRLLIEDFVEFDNTEILTYTYEEIESMTKSLIFVNKNTNIQNYTYLLTRGVSIYKKKNSYKFIYKKFVEFSQFIFETRNVFDDIKIYYAILFNEMKKDDPQSAINFYEDIFEGILPASFNANYIEFKQYCIKELLTCFPKEEGEKREKIFKYHVNSLFEIIDMDIKYNGLFFLPDFEEEILDNSYNKNKINSILSDIKSLINQSIMKDNVSAFFQLLNSLNKILEKTNKSDKEIQESLFDIYTWLISRTCSTVNKHFFGISFDMLEQAIDLLDKNRLISNSFGDYIIDSLAQKARNANTETQKIQDAVIGLLFSFMDENKEKNFVISSVDKKKRGYKSVFNIGIDCIENNYEEGLRRTSNAIGWFTIYSIKQKTSELTKYLIDRAIELYNISEKMDISSKTLTFILTLFTTVGMYCCKDNKNTGFLLRIYAGFKEEDFEKLNVAVSIRTSENDTWNDLFEGRTEELRKKFLGEFKNVKRASKGN